MSHGYLIGVIALLFGVTLFTRGLPFFLGEWIGRNRLFIMLAERLPIAIFVALLAYYMMAVAHASPGYHIVWQFVALLVTLALQWRYRNSVLSLCVGTAVFLILQQF